MKIRMLLPLIAAVAMMLTPVQPAVAGSNLGAGLAGGIVGGIIGGVIVNEANKKKQRRATTRSSYSNTQRLENREVQTSLNYFSFPAGTPDGVFGRRTRNAISTYQVYMGYPISGQLTEFQKTVLLTSYQRSIMGGAAVAQVVSTSPDGVRGMLKQTQRDFAGGGGNTTVYVAVPQQQTTVQPVTEAAGSAFKLPSFGAAPETKSMANYCNKISLITNTNGGYKNTLNMGDPLFALSEQFCLARIYAISQSEELVSQVQGVTSTQMQQQCETLGPAFKDQVAALSLGSRQQVLAKTSEVIIASGMSPAQLSHTAKICLVIGYRTDNTDVALASTLILVVLGQPVYGELLGHHLVNGFGTSKRQDLAVQWYVSATDAVVAGMDPVFVPGQADRTVLLQTAVARLEAPANGGSQSEPAGFLMPAFNSDSN